MENVISECSWLDLMERLGFAPNLDTYNELITHYEQPHRSYHNTHHLMAVLRHLREVNHLADDVNALELALWFHDAIYRVFSSSNELDSANWAKRFLIQNHAEPEFVNRVHSLVMATLHSSKPEGNDASLIVDIDLAILGCKSDLYDQFETWIRQEYKWIPGFIYRRNRRALLNSFLSRARIFNHDYFYERYESQARENLQKAIEKLS